MLSSDALILLAFIGRAKSYPRFSGENSEAFSYLPGIKEGNSDIQASQKPMRNTLGEQRTEYKTERKKRGKTRMSWD